MNHFFLYLQIKLNIKFVFPATPTYSTSTYKFNIDVSVLRMNDTVSVSGTPLRGTGMIAGGTFCPLSGEGN